MHADVAHASVSHLECFISQSSARGMSVLTVRPNTGIMCHLRALLINFCGKSVQSSATTVGILHVFTVSYVMSYVNKKLLV